MGEFLNRDDHVLEMASQFVDHSQMRGVVRHYGKLSDKLVVDVTEITTHRTSKLRANAFATKLVRKYGVASADCSQLCDFETERKATQFDGQVVLVRIRMITFAFQGVI